MDCVCQKTVLGDVTVFADGAQVVALDWGHGMDAPRHTPNAALQTALAALEQYFSSGQDVFGALNLNPHGTHFQKRVWNEMRKIPCGDVRTYGQIAKALNTSARAVGTACGANPIPILIPCHRVVAQGGLGGYTGQGGIETKTHLLRLEHYL